jgi:hypothetical protein
MSRGQKPMIGARVPQAWVAKIEAICQETGQTQSEVVQEAMARYLDVTDVDGVKSLARRVAVLERQYQKLIKLV